MSAARLLSKGDMRPHIAVCGEMVKEGAQRLVVHGGEQRQPTWASEVFGADSADEETSLTVSTRLPGGFSVHTFDEFRKRYESLDWCEANGNHPIAYLRAMNDQHNRLLDKIKTMRPMLLIRKGKRIAIVPSGSDEASKATREQILSEF